VESIQNAAKTGRIGEGKIQGTNREQVNRIRTGEAGEKASKEIKQTTTGTRTKTRANTTRNLKNIGGRVNSRIKS
jgi:Nitrogen regulatory protein PII